MESKHHTKLTAKERDLIAVWRGGDIGVREISRRLGRSHSTIIEEIKRNSFLVKLPDGRRKRYYVSIHAQTKTEKRAFIARHRHPLKDPVTYAYVIRRLGQGWSPEQISGRLRKKHGKTVVCHETVYRFIYGNQKEAKRLKLWEYLPRKQERRKKQHGRRVHRGQIPDRVSIHKRPAQVDTRQEIGHWEGDTLEGKGHRDGIHVEVERVIKLTRAEKVISISSEETIKAQEKIFSTLPERLRRSTTLDNGRENHLHTKLKVIGMETFFCDPYASYQKGTVENTNGLIRRYLPKGTDFTSLTQEELDDIVEEINNRPRKALNYSTPNEALQTYLGGRIQTRM